MAAVQQCSQARHTDEEKQEFVQGEAPRKWKRYALISFVVLAALVAQSMLTAGLVLAMVRSANLGGTHVSKTGVLVSASNKPVATAAAVHERKLDSGLKLEQAKLLRTVTMDLNGKWTVYVVASVHKVEDKIHILALDGTKIVIDKEGVTVTDKDGRRLGNAGGNTSVGQFNDSGSGAVTF